MSQAQIKQLITRLARVDGMQSTGIAGVQVFRISSPIRCVPAVYEPAIVAIVNGSKEALLDGQRYVYDANRYLCCAMNMPVEAGTPNASADNPLLGVVISLNTRVMTELAIEIDSASSTRAEKDSPPEQGFALAQWDEHFTEALWRLLQLGDSPADARVLTDGRLRELYYAVFKGQAGRYARQAFGVGNQIARTIDYFSTRLDQPVTIDEMAALAGMSRAVFHRKFKQATTLSPIQFMKAMRLNTAAMNIAQGMNVSRAAMQVGYISSSQFSREFKRLYGQSPKQWIAAQ